VGKTASPVFLKQVSRHRPFILLTEADKNDDIGMVKTVVWNNGSGILIYSLKIKMFNFEQ
jgi:hypothetical protein